jgi:hypothetical protein
MSDRFTIASVPSLRLCLVLAPFLALAACATEETGPEPFAAKRGARTIAPRAAGNVGTAQRRAQGEHCCFEGKYQRCASPVACFGGVDLDECVARCAGDDRCLTNVCTSELRHAPAPRGCTAAEAPASFPCD